MIFLVFKLNENEQLLTIAEGKDPSKDTMHLSKEAQHLAKS